MDSRDLVFVYHERQTKFKNRLEPTHLVTGPPLIATTDLGAAMAYRMFACRGPRVDHMRL